MEFLSAFSTLQRFLIKLNTCMLKIEFKYEDIKSQKKKTNQTMFRRFPSIQISWHMFENTRSADFFLLRVHNINCYRLIFAACRFEHNEDDCLGGTLKLVFYEKTEVSL